MRPSTRTTAIFWKRRGGSSDRSPFALSSMTRMKPRVGSPSITQLTFLPSHAGDMLSGGLSDRMWGFVPTLRCGRHARVSR